MSLDGARLHYVDKEGATVVVPAKGRSFQVGAYLSCDLLLGGEQGERLICEIMRDAFGRVYLYNKSISETIHLDDKAILQGKKRPLLHGGRIKIFDQDYTWEFPKSDDAEDVPSTPERLSPAEQGSNSCPSLKSHRAQIDKRLTVHNFHYSINSDDEGNTSIESRDQDESLAEAENDLNLTAPPSLDLMTCETPKVDLVEATQNKENTTSTPASHQKLLMLCARSDVVITSFSPRETGVKIEKSFTCVRKPAVPTIANVSTPKSVYSTPKGVLSEPNDDSCSRDLMDFSTPSTSKKGKRESSMFLIDLTTPSKLRSTINAKQLPTPISVDSTDESSDGSPMVIDITNSATSQSPAVSQLKQQNQTPRRLVGAPATPKRTPQSLMKRALLTSTKKQIASNCAEAKGSPTATPTHKRTSLLEARRQCLTTPRRLPFHPHRQTPVHRPGSNEDRNKPPKTSPRKKLPQNLGTPRENKLSQLRKSLALSKRSPGVDKSNRLVAKACRSLNSPKSGSPKPASPKPESPVNRLTFNVSEKCSTPEQNDESTSELSRTFTILDESQDGDKSKATSVVETVAALVTGEVSFQIEDSVKALDKSLPLPLKSDETKTGRVATDLELKEKEIEPKEDTKPSVSVDAGQVDANDVIPDLEPQSSKAVEVQSVGDVENPEEDPETAPIIEESICEEVQVDIPEKSLDEADKTFEVVEDIICEEVQTEVKPNDKEAASPIKHKETSSVQPQTPVTRRSSRRLSVDQRAAVTTPRRSSRRASMEASKKAETDTTKKLKRRASYSAVERHDATTPRRKRRVSEDVSTPTRQSKRLLNTPKKTLAVDESVGDMGVIVEETSHDHGEKSIIADDEDYGNELPGDEVDKVDYHGLRDLLKTPKSCSTPRFKGLREMMRTPKVPASPILDNIEEMLESSAGSTPHHKSSSVSAAHVTIDGGKLLDRVLKTPSARNIMVPNDPASAVLKSRTDSVAPTTEYNLSMGNATLHLDKIFDDVDETANDTEVEINVTTVSTVADPLEKSTKNDSISSEALMSVCSTTSLSALKDPLTSTTYKGALQADQHIGAKNEHRPASPEDGEMSGIQLLDQTSDSMFSEPLIVSGVDSCDITVEETKADVPIKLAEEHSEDRSDTDSTVGLTEPLVMSDDDEEGSGTPKKSKDKSAAEKLDETVKGESIVDTLEESVNQEVPAKDTPSNDDVSSAGASISKASEKLEESQIEISLIEADESAAETDKSLVIELDDSSDTETPPKGTNESASVDLTILDGETSELAEESKSIFENETYYLDSTAECRSVNQSRNVDSVIDISKATDVLSNETSEDVSNYISPEVESEPSVEPTESISELLSATDDVAVQEVPDVSSEINSSPGPEKADPPVSDNNSEEVSIASVSEQSRDDNQDVSFVLPAEDASVAEEAITSDTNKEAEETAPITIEEIPSMDKEFLSDAAINDGKEEVAEDKEATPEDNEDSPLTLANPAESEGKAQQTKDNEAEAVSSDVTVEDNDIFEESSVTDKSVKEAVESENSAAKIDIPSLDKPAYQDLSEETGKAEKSDEKTEDVETEIQSKEESRVQEETTTSVAETLSNTTSEITSAEVELSSNNDSDVCFMEESLSQNQADETSEDVDNFDEKSEVLESTNAASFTGNDTSIPSLDRSLQETPLLEKPKDTTTCDVKESDEKTEGANKAASSQVASSSNIEVLPAAEPSSQADKTLGNAEDSILDTETDTQGVVDVSTSDAKTSADVLKKGLEESMLGETPENDSVQVNSILETESVQEPLVEETAPHNLSIAELTRLDAFASLEEETDEVIQLGEEDSDGAPAEEVISAEEIEVPISEESTSKDTIQDADAIEEAKDVCLADDSTTKQNQELNKETALENATEEVKEINPPEQLDAPSTKIISQPCNDIAAKPEILKDAGPKSSKPTQFKAVTDEAIVDTESLRRLDMELDQLEDTALDQPGFDIDDDLEILNDKPIQVSGKEVSEKQEETSEIETASSNTLKELESNQAEELDVPSTESIPDQPGIPSESLNNVDSETTKPTQVCEKDVAEENEVTFETDTCPEDADKELESKQPEELDASSTKLDDTEVSDEDKEKEPKTTIDGEDTQEQEVTIAARPSNPTNQPEDVLSIESEDQPSITEDTEVLDDVVKEPEATPAKEVTEEQEITFEAETCPSNQPEDVPSESIRDQPSIDDSESVKNPEVRDEEVTEQQEVTIPTEISPSDADHESTTEVQAPDVVEDLAKPSNDINASPENSFQTENENQNDSILIEDDSLPAKETQESLKLTENLLEGMEEAPASTKEPNLVIEIEDSSSSEQEFGKSAVDVDKPDETLIIDEDKSSSKQSETNIPDADIPPTTDDTKVMTSNDLPEDDKKSQESKSALDAVMEEAQEEPPQSLDDQSKMDTGVDQPVKPLDTEPSKEATDATEANDVTIISDDESEGSPKEEGNQIPAKEEKAPTNLTSIETTEEPTPQAEAVSHPIPKPSIDEEDTPKEEKAVKRTTRKGSAHADPPNEAIDLGRTKRRGRKPSADVVEEATDQKPEESSKRRLRKPSKDVEESKQEHVAKSPKGKPKLRGRTPSSEVAEEVAQDHKEAEDLPPIVEEALESPAPNEQSEEHAPTHNEKVNSSDKSEEVIHSEDKINSEESPKTNAEEVAPKKDAGAEHKGDHEEPKKRRGRKPSADVASSSSKDPAKEVATHDSEPHKKEQELPSIPEKESSESKATETPESHDPTEKPKRRGRKPSNNVVHADVEKPKRRAKTPADTDDSPEKKTRRIHRKASAETVELPEKEPSQKIDEQVVLDPISEEKPSTEAKVEDESGKATEPSPLLEKEEPKTRRRGRKPTAESAEIPSNLVKSPEPLAEKEEHKIRRRGRKATAETVELATKEDLIKAGPKTETAHETPKPLAEEAEHKPRRRGRKLSVEAENVSTLKDLVHSEAGEKCATPPKTEPEPLVPVPEVEEEPKTRRRGRKPTAETVEIPAKKEATPEAAPVAVSRRRGRKATEDEDHSTMESKPKRRARKASVEEVKDDVPVTPQVDLPSVVVVAPEVVEKKPARRARKASSNVDELTPAKKAPARRARKADASHDDELEKQINLHDLPTENVDAVIVTSASVETPQDPASSGEAAEEEMTPRRREGRNLPRKNYDETSDEDKRSSSHRRARKPAVTKAPVAEAPQVTPQKIVPPVEEVATPVNTMPPPEPTTSQRREGRNLPRKNYAEAPDEDKRSASRSRRVRQPTVKALELIVSNSPRPDTPKKRKGKAAAGEEPQEKKVAQEAPAPQAAVEPAPAVTAPKARGGRRKAEEIPVGEPLEPEVEAKPAKKNARAPARKAKAPVEAPAEDHPPAKKSRVASRAKTPVAAAEEATPEPEVPAKKPAARSRARGGAKAAKAAAVVEEPQPPAQESETEAPASTAARGGRARKVHFEASITPAEAAGNEAAAPKRATRSRRK
ncbi:fap1 adhesin isoform X2 [Drosophila bipectinata]|uniref:fap1 adhesin isoform X2 n=1 Tax=Drosophila bipectinata TaxID=42026 RepID=UPI0038B3EC1B